jgi:hypothetical protein
MSRPSRFTALLVLALVASAALILGPYVLRERAPVAATGTPPPFGAAFPLALAPGDEVCSDDLLLTPGAAVGQVVLVAGVRAPASLQLTAAGPGYAATSRPESIERPGKRPRERTFRLQFTPPARELRGRVCIRNVGDAPTRVAGTDEPTTQTRARTRLNGRPVPADLSITFYEDREVSLAAGLPDAVRNAAQFRGFLGAEWLLWVLIALVCVGVPAAVVAALHRALREDAPPGG